MSHDQMLFPPPIFCRPAPPLHLDLRAQVQLPRLPSQQPLLVLVLELRPQREQEDRHEELGLRLLRVGRQGIAQEAAARQQVRILSNSIFFNLPGMLNPIHPGN